jgi:hypothetical protein
VQQLQLQLPAGQSGTVVQATVGNLCKNFFGESMVAEALAGILQQSCRVWHTVTAVKGLSLVLEPSGLSLSNPRHGKPMIV